MEESLEAAPESVEPKSAEIEDAEKLPIPWGAVKAFLLGLALIGASTILSSFIAMT